MSEHHTTPHVAVAKINLIAGNAQGSPSEPNWALIERQHKLIQDELNEMRDNIANRNIEGIRDDIGDVLFTAYGMGHRCGYPSDLDLAEVCRSNMTKFDTDIDDAKISQQKYLAIGVETTITYKEIGSGGAVQGYYVLHSARDQTGQDGKSYPGGKWLKSYKFEEPVFEDLIPELA